MEPLNPRDIVVLVKAHYRPGLWTSAELERALGLDPGRVGASLLRAEAAGLFWASQRLLVPSAFLEFAVHGLRYAFPSRIGTELVHGIATAHTAPPLRGRILSRVAYVWPSPGGETIGRAVDPLDPCVYRAIEADDATYRALALLDALRVGGTRDRHMAAALLEEQLGFRQPDQVAGAR